MYYYRVYAFNSAGEGEASPVFKATVGAGPPSAPLNLTAVENSNDPTRVWVSWQAPTSDGGAAVEGYLLQYSTDGGQTWITANDPNGTNLYYPQWGLEGDTTYHYRVFALNTAGKSPASAVDSATTIPADPPGPPASVTAKGGKKSVLLEFERPLDNGGARIQGYRIEYRDDSDSSADWQVLEEDIFLPIPIHVVDNLSPGTPYSFRMAAINKAGTGTWSDIAAAATNLERPGAPTGFSAIASGITIDLSWIAPVEDGGEITGYALEWTTDSSDPASWRRIDLPETDTSYTHAALSAQTAYYYRVATVNSAGESASYAEANATTGTPPACNSLWCATATVTRQSSNLVGYKSDGSYPGSSLQPDTFAYGGQTYTVSFIAYNSTNDKVSVTVYPALPTNPSQGFNLLIGNDVLAFSQASYNGFQRIYSWDSSATPFDASTSPFQDNATLQIKIASTN